MKRSEEEEEGRKNGGSRKGEVGPFAAPKAPKAHPKLCSRG